MPIPISCPSCQRRLQARDEHAGKTLKCPACKASIAVPALDDMPTLDFAPPLLEAAAPRAVRKRIGCKGMLVFAGVALAAGFAAYHIFSPRLAGELEGWTRRKLEERILEATGFRAKIGDLGFDMSSGAYVDNLTLSEDAAGGTPLMSIGRIRLKANSEHSLWKGRLDYAVTLENVRYVLDAKGPSADDPAARIDAFIRGSSWGQPLDISGEIFLSDPYGPWEAAAASWTGTANLPLAWNGTFDMKRAGADLEISDAFFRGPSYNSSRILLKIADGGLSFSMDGQPAEAIDMAEAMESVRRWLLDGRPWGFHMSSGGNRRF